VSKRPYRQQLRAEGAEETRRRILDALYDRLREAPAEPVTVDEIARRAAVARSTVYLVFGSRTGLFDALTDRVLFGPGYERILEAVRQPDALETVRGGLAGGVEMYAAHHDVLRVLNAMAKLDPEGAGRALGRSEQERTRGMAMVAQRLAEQGRLRPDVSAGRAAHVMWVLTSFEAYDLLATGRGLEPPAIAELLVATAEQALLAG
jgi:AcrR family transcriptional regulator